MASRPGHRLSRADVPVAEAAEAAPSLGTEVQDHLGAQLRAYFQTRTIDAVPATLLGLIEQLEKIKRRGKPVPDTFRSDLIDALPALRGFAVSLAGSIHADDFVQETVLKAWKYQHHYEPGTNFKAWLFTILRNLFYSHLRRKKREVEDVDGALAAQLIQLPSQEPSLMLQNIEANLRKLPPSQREALILVGAQGMTYEAAAGVLRCQVGTVKSRVSRGRAMLVGLMGMGDQHAA